MYLDESAYSDARIKTDFETIPNALEKVCSMSGYTFARKGNANHRQAGVIAQEVLTVLPEVVHQDKEGMYSVAYGNMVALLIEAIKEIKLQLDKKQD